MGKNILLASLSTVGEEMVMSIILQRKSLAMITVKRCRM